MTVHRRYQLDSTVERHGNVLVGGSPLKLFRLTAAGSSVVERIAEGEPVAASTLVTALSEAGAIHPVPDHQRHTVADVTIVVPTLGMPAHVPDGAIVIDDGSDPPVPGAAVRLSSNQGPGAARNAGLAQVTTPLVAFVDADVELPHGWLDTLLPHFVDDRVALVAPRVRSGPSTSLLGRYEHDHGPLDLGSEPARVRAGSRVSYVPAAAIVCRAEAIRSIDGFDASLRFGEDVDLVWRLDRAGWVCRYEPTTEVNHAVRPDTRSWVRQRIDYGSSAAPLAKRHPRALAPLRMSGWSIGAWTLGAIGRPVLGAALGAGSAAALVKKLPDIPPAAALRLAGSGNLHAGGQIAGAIRRVWWPLLLLLAWRWKPPRRVLFAAALAARHPFVLADDLAYSIGVWKGMLKERTPDPLIPQISSWPGRSRPATSADVR